MKRLHIHLRADDLALSEKFYTAMFGQAPTVSKPDYLKWMLDDPRINFAVTPKKDDESALNHLGIQVESDEELEAVNGSLLAAEQATVAEPEAHCCYATGNKHWARDPEGIVWEMFHTMSDAVTYGVERPELEDEVTAPAPQVGNACCG